MNIQKCRFLLIVFSLVVLVVGIASATENIQEDIQKKWQAYWHGTNWIDDGATIESQKIAENFEWLYEQVTKRLPTSRLPRGTVVAGCLTTRTSKNIERCRITGYDCPERVGGFVCSPIRDCWADIIYIYEPDVCWGGASVPPNATELTLVCPDNTVAVVTSDNRLGFCVVE